MRTLNHILNRNVESIYPSKAALTKRLLAKEPLKIYLGIDPSSPRIHLGNAIALWKLKEFQEKGHKIILLIGDFTATIGDPTGRSTTRPALTLDQVRENSVSYKEQASKILSFEGKNAAEIKYNSQWLSKLNLTDLVKLSSNFTVQQFIERDMFQERLKEKKPIGLNEFLYPLMQGYDSVAMEVDLEIGGTDQTFNMLIGREMTQKLLGKEKFVLTLPLLPGTDGRKMSKSFNNSIDISDPPNEMFGKIMSLKDELILKYFELCTNVQEDKLQEVKSKLNKENPMGIKKRLARTIVTLYYSENEAQKAQDEFERVFQNRGLPTYNVEQHRRDEFPKPASYASVATVVGLTSSVSEAVRLAEQGGLVFDGKEIRNAREEFPIETAAGTIIQVGKRRIKGIEFTE